MATTRRNLVGRLAFGSGVIIFALFVGAGLAQGAAKAAPEAPPPLFVTMELEIAGAKPVTVVAREGEITAYRDLALGHSVAVLVDVIDSEAPADVELEVLDVSFDLHEKVFTRGESHGVVLGRVGVESYVPVSNAALLEVTILGIGNDPWEVLNLNPAACGGISTGVGGPYEEDPNPGGGSSGPCCVSCNGTTICGCAVALGGCGSCCGCGLCG